MLHFTFYIIPYIYVYSWPFIVTFTLAISDAIAISGCSLSNNPKLTLSITNFVTVVCLVITFLVSLLITVWYSAVGAFDLFNNSIRFNSDGNYVIGKLFWKIVFNRGAQELGSEPNEHHIELSERLNENNVQRLDQ